MAQWDGSRIPVAFARIRRTDTPDDQPETALFRRMRQEFRGPPWGQEVVVTADAAYASRANRAPIQALGHWDVRARPRTWQFANGQAVNDPVLHLPRGTSPQSRMPPGNTPRRRTFGVYAKRGQRRHLGDVTGGLRTWRRHAGPKQPTIPVTHLPEPVTARESGGVDLRRWGSELLRKELTGGVGLGQQQVTQKVDRVEPSVAVAIMAYLLLLKLHAKAIPADRPWRAFRLQRAFAWEVIQEHGERSAHQMARKWLQLGKAA